MTWLCPSFQSLASQFDKNSQYCAMSVELARMLCYIMAHVIYKTDRAGGKDFDMKTREQQESRQSMWSVRPTLVPFYFMFFTLAVVVGNVFIVWYEVSFVTADATPETLIGIIQGVGWVGLATAIGTFTLTEIMEHAMVMANWFRQQYLEPLKERQRNEGREQGREEGRAELLAEIREWDARRRKAEARGETFSEPPPYASNGQDN